ncbi:MAG: GNAT family N-acetyltransferase [Caulobacter sp.]|nr:GNAT family N-acetyltransferase [Caulobacter sp.]
MTETPLTLVTPARDHLPAFVAALERGWSPDTTAGGEVTRQALLTRIAEEADAVLAGMDDPKGRAGDVRLPDGSMVPRLPGFTRWLWADGFCGSINFRWQAGTEALPPHCLGHVGYSVLPWERGKGHATAALGLLLPLAHGSGLRWIDLETDPANVASHRVIVANGGRLTGPITRPAAYGGGEGLMWRIAL